ncbi:MAG TPA: T9SS type A sorting domain-containing protein, partial [Bacteroidales bacterium]|nr:T9SS type A sorting domain-containing protein [Bacteroidales bacterium]
SSWNVVSDGYNDNPGMTAPYPKVEINPVLSQTADVWIQERTNGNGEALFDAKYSTYNGVPEAAGENAVTLFGAHPNPCNESTSIAFELKQPEHVTITLYDVYGKPEQVITDKTYNAGNFNEKVDLSGLAGGCYYFTFKAGNFTSSGKIIVIR